MEPDKQVKTRGPNGRWKKGQSGNPNGRPKKNLCIADVLREIGEEEYQDGITNLEQVMRVVYKKALKGEMRSIEHICERLEGKPPVTEIRNDNELCEGFNLVVIE